MRHNRKLRKLNRTAAERKALFRALVTALLKRQRITTTIAKAKEARRVAEKIITLGKKADLASQRLIFALLQDRSLVKEICTDIAPRFKNRQGGYTRIIRISNRRKGDNAELVILELTEQKVIAPVAKKAGKEKKQETAEIKKEEKKPHKEEPSKHEAPKHEAPKHEAPKHAPKEEKRPPVEKGKKGFFQNLKKFLKPKTG